MSDLTITHGGVSVTKRSGGEVLSNNKKLGQMNVDLIDVTCTSNSAAHTIGDIICEPIKIENAVAVKGGAAILQSAALIVGSGGQEVGAITAVITNNGPTDLAGIAANDAWASGSDALAVYDGFCGMFTFTNGVDEGAVTLHDKHNIGMVCKAEAGSRDLYIFLVAQSTDDYDANNLVVRLGFVQD